MSSHGLFTIVVRSDKRLRERDGGGRLVAHPRHLKLKPYYFEWITIEPPPSDVAALESSGSPSWLS